MRREWLLDLSPFVLTIYPILYMLSANVSFVDFSEITLSLFGYLLGTLGILFLFRRIFKNKYKATFFTNVIVVIFFIYGHIYNLIDKGLGHWLLMPITLSVVVFSLHIIRRKSRWLPGIIQYMGIFGTILLLMAMGTVIEYSVGAAKEFPRNLIPNTADFSIIDPEMLNDKVEMNIPNKASLPDIYYIILDEYANSNILMEMHGFDNTPFLDALRERDFFVAEESRANYPTTFLSLASSLNMGYLNFLDGRSLDFSIPYHMIDYNRVSAILQQAGYQIVYLPSIYDVTNDVQNADIIYKFERELPLIGLDYSNFDLALVDSTLLGSLLSSDEDYDILGGYRETTLYSLSNLRQIPAIDKPTFTFAHITVPHKPYVFTAEDAPLPASLADGQVIAEGTYAPYTSESTIPAYLGQINFINRSIITIVDDIIANSEIPPVIIIQSDHGNRMQDEPGIEAWGAAEIYHNVFPILSTYYLPGYDMSTLSPSITPVNTFRVVLDHYLGTNLGLIEEHNYYPEGYFSFDFIEVTNGIIQTPDSEE